MSLSDNTPELRARLRPSPRRDTARARVHDFDNLVTEFSFATQLQDREQMAYYAAELRRQFEQALKKRK